MKNSNFKFQLYLAVRHFIFLSFLLFARNINAISQDKNLTILLPYFTPKENETWNFITTKQYGVAGSGFVGKDQFIGMCFAKHELGGPWTPIDGYKHTLCGQLYLPHNGKYVEDRSGDDGDIDFYIFPDPAFQRLILNSKNPNGNDDVPKTVLGEISFKEPGDNPLTDGAAYLASLPPTFCLQSIGIYGAWVTDINEDTYLGVTVNGSHHDYRPEIHPIEQMWQKKDINQFTTEFYLFSMHDNEGRFGRGDEFINPALWDSKPSDCNLPWIKNPQIDTFYIPFEVGLSGASINYNIESLSGLNINANSTYGNTARLLYKGAPLITITRPSASYPSITFYGLGMKNSNTIRGYIAIETSIAKLGNTRTDGAHLFLKVTRTNGMGIGVHPILQISNHNHPDSTKNKKIQK